MPRRLRRCLHRLRVEEDGIALPTALLATVASMALAGAAVVSTVDVQQSSHRDSSTKSAIGVADAGVNVALLRIARDSAELETAYCLEGGTPSNGWCPAVSGEVGGGTYSYQISQPGTACGQTEAAQEKTHLCVVVNGTVNGVSRRVMVLFNLSHGKLFEIEQENPEYGVTTGGASEGLIGVEEINIENNSDARVNVGTNGNVHVQENGNVCGNIRHGIGKEATIDNNGTQCEGYEVTEANINVPSVESFMPADIATNNSDYRLAKCTSTKPTPTPTGCQSDEYTGKWTGTVPYDSTTRTISTANNSSLTLGGGDYWVCKLELSNNSHLIMAATAKVRIFFDTPEHCGLSAGAKQIYVANNANIEASNYRPEEGIYQLPGFYLIGSPTVPTTVEWNNNSGTNEVMIYAPNSNIILENNATFYGVIAGKTVLLNDNVVVTQDAGFELEPWLNPWGTEGPTLEGPPKSSPPSFAAKYYVECTGTASTTPSEGC